MRLKLIFTLITAFVVMTAGGAMAAAPSTVHRPPSTVDTIPVTRRGITPPRNLRNYDMDRGASFGAMLGVRRYSSAVGDTLVGFVPVYYLGGGLLKVEDYTVLHSGNVGSYAITSESDPTVPAYAKTLSSASVVLGGLLGVDGAGSGLDADLLDGQHGSYYLALANATGTLAATSGGTGIASYAVGDLLYANTTTSLAKLADVAIGNALLSGGVGTAPAWGKIGLTTHVSGTLPIANGGTNLSALGTANQLLRVNAGATALEYFTPSYLTANQTITLTGAVTGSGSTSIATTLASNSVATGNILDGTIAAADLSALGATASGQVLTWNGSAWAAAAASGGISGSGSATYLPKWTSGSALGNSVVFDHGSGVGVNSTSTAAALVVRQTTNTQRLLDVDKSITDGSASATSFTNFYNRTTFTPTATSGLSVTNFSNNLVLGGSGSHSLTGTIVPYYNSIDFGGFGGNVSALFGTQTVLVSFAAATATQLRGTSTELYNAGGTWGEVYGNYTRIGGGITTAYGYFAEFISYTNIPVTTYGVYISNSTATANKWGVYQVQSTGKNYFAGNVLLGSTSNNGVDILQVTGTSNFSGVAKFTDGTVAAPGMTFSSGLGVGLSRPGSNQLAFSTAGIERLKLGASGEVYFAGSAGTSGQMLRSNGTSSAPTWVTGALLPTGTSGQTLRHDGTSWAAASNISNTLTNVDMTATTQWSLFVGGQGLYGVSNSITAQTADFIIVNPLAAGLPAAGLQLFEDNDNSTPQRVRITTPTITANYDQTFTAANGEIGAWLRTVPVALDFPATNMGAFSELTITLANAVVGKPCIVGYSTNVDGIFKAYCSVAGQVVVRYTNTSLISVNPSSATFEVHQKL